MKALIFFILLLSFCNFGFSQTIINAERLINGADSTIYSISLAYAGNKGNSNTDQLDIAPAVVLLRKNNDYKFFGGYNLLSQDEKNILRGGFIHLRHNYRITDRIKTFEFYQLQFNDVLLLSKREVFGAGLRFGVLKNETLKFDLSIGPMREVEILNKNTLAAGELSEFKYVRANSVSSLKFVVNKSVSINNITYYQPYLKDFRDFRLLNDFSMTVAVTDHINMLSSITTRFDSQPPGALKKIDNVISLGLSLKF